MEPRVEVNVEIHKRELLRLQVGREGKGDAGAEQRHQRTREEDAGFTQGPRLTVTNALLPTNAPTLPLAAERP